MKCASRFDKFGSFFLLSAFLLVQTVVGFTGCATTSATGPGPGASGRSVVGSGGESGDRHQTMAKDGKSATIPWAATKVPDNFLPDELADVPLRSIPRFVFINMGQADSTLILFNGKSMLVDAGSSMTSEDRYKYKNIVKALRKFTGKLHLDYVVVSHYHADHLGQHLTYSSGKATNTGLYGLIEEERVTVGTIIDRGSAIYGIEKPNPQRIYEKMVLRWLSDGLVQKRRSVSLGDTIDMGPGMQIEVISSSANDLLKNMSVSNPSFLKKWPPSENDYSIGLKFTVGNFEMFTAGDLSGFDAQKSYGGGNNSSYNDVETLIAHDITDVEIYRVNHHGSENSSNPCFISVLNPEVSISSTGVNGYGHPDVRVMELLLDVGEVLITSGVAEEMESLYGEYVVGGNIGVQVHPSGEKYWVHGREFQSLDEEEEAARPDYGAACEGWGNSGGAGDEVGGVDGDGLGDFDAADDSDDSDDSDDADDADENELLSSVYYLHRIETIFGGIVTHLPHTVSSPAPDGVIRFHTA